jgi:MFS family permease
MHHASRLLVAKGIRAFGDGYVSLLLPLYLIALGYGPVEVGVLATATLLGSGLLTLAVGLHAHRFHYRGLLLATTVVLGLTGLGFAVVRDFWPLLLVAFVGTLNPSSGDVSVFLPLEHAVLARVVEDRKRTHAFARYSLVGSLGAAVGALAASLPDWMERHWGIPHIAALQSMFALYGMAALPIALVYRGLPRTLGSEERRAPAPLTRSKARVYTLAALFSVDAFAGGLVVQSMLALWLYGRFDLSPAQAGAIFFWTGLASAASFLVAARIAERVGLVNTMVFTHLPANLCLIAVPFVDSLAAALVLLFIRAALSQMDVPTRSSYVMAIVLPEERPAAASITAVPRSLASSASPLIAGWLLGVSGFGWPLVAAGALKVAYDLALLLAFRRIKPPEEAAPTPLR